MNNSMWKFLGATAAFAVLVATAMPQSGPLGRKNGGGGSNGGGSGGGQSRGGGSSGRGSGSGGGPARNDPPPRRNDGGGSNGGGSQGGGSRDGGSRGGGGPVVGGGSGGGSQSGGDGGYSRGGGSNGGGSRIDVGGSNDGYSRRRNDSRSGRVEYGTNGNMYGQVKVGGVRIERAPVIINNGQLNRRVGQSERIGLVREGYRYGYYHYRRDWRDDNFCYPFYAFDPWAYNRCVVSPWYYYYSLPAYVNYSRVTIVNVFPTTNWYGSPYRWQPIDRWDRNQRYEDLDYAIQDIEDAFERDDRRSLDRIAPRDGRVNIYTEGNYSYSLGANDFYDLYRDGIDNVQTVRYEILDVQRNRDGNARVLARHEFTDPWGTRQVVWHNYYLQREGRDYVIREFGTSYYRSGW